MTMFRIIENVFQTLRIPAMSGTLEPERKPTAFQEAVERMENDPEEFRAITQIAMDRHNLHLALFDFFTEGTTDRLESVLKKAYFAHGSVLALRIRAGSQATKP